MYPLILIQAGPYGSSAALGGREEPDLEVPNRSRYPPPPLSTIITIASTMGHTPLLAIPGSAQLLTDMQGGTHGTLLQN